MIYVIHDRWGYNSEYYFLNEEFANQTCINLNKSCTNYNYEVTAIEIINGVLEFAS